MNWKILTAMVISGTAAAMAAPQVNNIEYPKAPADPTVTDNYFGMVVADPYRPLEDDMSPATAAWVEAENAVTRAYLDAIPQRAAIHSRLTELNDYRKRGLPWRANDGKFYYFENDGLQPQSVLYRKNAVTDDAAEIFIDPNKLSDDGTVALTGIEMSPDGKYTAYTISRSGSDWTEIYLLDTATGDLLPDHIEWAKFSGATWRGNDGFFYSAYDRPEAGREVSEKNENHRIYYHRLGTPQSDDQLIYEDKANPLHFHSAWVDDDGKWLLIYGSGEGIGNSIMMRPADAPADAPWTVVEATQDFPHSVLDIRDGKMYIYTTWGAPRGRIMVADASAPQRDNWVELIPEDPTMVLGGLSFTSDRMLTSYSEAACSRLFVNDPATGARIAEIKLPTFGVAGLSTNHKYPDIRYSFASFTYPSTQFEYDPATGKSTEIYRSEIKGVNFDDYITEQVFYPSADGTMIPMFLTYRKDLKRDGSNPVYLYGYGGFNISLPPGFSPNRMLWLENGGIYAQAGLRGGSEMGEEWHLAGTKQQKLNVFNDFIAAAEYMIAQGWTSPENLVIEGGSNGGLLVGATVNMRPDLFAVAIPRVGVMDMMRYHLFTIGWNWASDYGTSADSPEMAAYLLGYSPLHNIHNDGTPYPAIMVTTADHDDRVVPAHSFKYAAALQAADTGSAPKLIRIDSKAGHGGGKPVGKVIDEYADIYSFIFKNLGKDVK